MPNENTEVRRVVCGYTGNCLRRDMYDEVDQEQAQYCWDCGQWYCRVHRHASGTRISQWCGYHQSYHPQCVPVEDGLCDEGRHSRMRYSGSYREPTLIFEGLPESHRLAYGKRFVGLEIEVENGGNFTLPREFGITRDGSLNNSGVEVLTPPCRGEALVDRVKIAMDTLKAADYQATNSCGLHVHVDLRDRRYDMRFLSRLYALAFAMEDVMFSLQKVDRQGNHFCMPLRDHYKFYAMKGSLATDFTYTYYDLDKSRYSKRMITGYRRQKYHDKRYFGFNFHSVLYRGTLECRIHEGTLDADETLLWIDLIQAIVDRAEKRISFKELEALMAEKNRTKKIDRVKRALGLRDDLVHYLHMNLRTNLVKIPYQLDDNSPWAH